MFSDIILPLTKAVWLELIKSLKQDLSLSARILVIHLYSTLQHAIGLNSVIEEGLGTLGTKVMIVELTSFKRELEWKKDFTAEHTSLPTMGQAFLKNKQ